MSNNQKKHNIIKWALCILMVFLIIFCIIYVGVQLGLARKDDTIPIIIAIPGAIVAIIAIINIINKKFLPKSIPHSDEIIDNKSNEGNSNEEQGNEVENQSQEKQTSTIGSKGNRINIWWNRYRKQISISLVAFSVLCVLFIFGYRFIENRKQQKQFAVLDGNFNNQMKQELTYKNACEQITDDYILLQRMVKMIQDKPNLGDSSYYIEQFQNQADIAIKKIVNYMHDPNTTPLERDKRCSEYKSQKDSINNMRNKFKL